MHASIKPFTLAPALLALLLLAACSEPTPEPPADPPAAPAPETTPAPTDAAEEAKSLTILYWQAPSLPSPYLSGGTKDTDAAAVTLEPLANFGPDGRLVPKLAAEIPTIENGGFSPDLTSITWKLREGLKWSDGSDMTADDVVFTWRYCMDEETGCTAGECLRGHPIRPIPRQPHRADHLRRANLLSLHRLRGRPRCLSSAASSSPAASVAPP